MVEAPKFIKDPHFYVDENGFHLKVGAPKDVQAEFEAFMRQQKQAEQDGVEL